MTTEHELRQRGFDTVVLIDSNGNAAGSTAGNIGSVTIDQSLPILDSTGGLAYPDNYAHTITRNGDGTVNTDAFTDGVNTWTQTFGYTNGLVTSISRWVKT